MRNSHEMIEREITPLLFQLFEQNPIVTVTGPRQSGKTTLCLAAFSNLKYVNLEDPHEREIAEIDPKGFLARLGGGTIIDEIQRVPELLSYIQVLVDEDRRNGQYVLISSQNFSLSTAISQSLAGRTGLLHLLPFNMAERQRTGAGNSVQEVLYSGFYPRIHNQGIEPSQAFADYIETYVERDVRQLANIQKRSAFQRFVRLCAGRIGQLTDFVALGSDVGVSHTTARNWFHVLEISYIAFRLPPYFANIKKRLVKSPRIYFYDVGLACYLLGIKKAEQISTHPLQGALFENLVVLEALKFKFNNGCQYNLSFFRDHRGLECDLLLDTANRMAAIEAKSGVAIASSFFDSLNAIEKLIPKISMKAVVYGGTERQSRRAGEVLPFGQLYDLFEHFELRERRAESVRYRSLPTPSETDVDILDTIFRKFIQPVLGALNRSLTQQEITLLFRELRFSSSIKYFKSTFGIASLTNTEDWERARSQGILKRGFKLNQNTPLEISQQLFFVRHDDAKDSVFQFRVTLKWTIENEGFLQSASIGEFSIPELNDYVRYSEISTRNPKIHRTCASIINAIIQKIER